VIPTGPPGGVRSLSAIMLSFESHTVMDTDFNVLESWAW
jgi:hypothetical protein